MMAEGTFTQLQAVLPSNTTECSTSSCTVTLNLAKVDHEQVEIIAYALTQNTDMEILKVMGLRNNGIAVQFLQVWLRL